MAEKMVKKEVRKIAPKKEVDRASSPLPAAVVVGTYKDRQLAWIKRHGIYNYPVREGGEFDAKAFAAVKELWLYADAKGTRHVFDAEFVGVIPRKELVAEHGYPADGVFSHKEHKGHKDGRAVSMKPPHGHSYYVFKTKWLEYGSRLDAPIVIARTADFGRRTAKVRKAIEQFKADGEFAPLAHYLPFDLSQIPHNRLRVCEAAVQYYFWEAIAKPLQLADATSASLPKNARFTRLWEGRACRDRGFAIASWDLPNRKDLKPTVPFPPPKHPKFTFIDLFAGIGGFRLAM